MSGGKNYGPNVSGYLNPVGRNWEDVIFEAGKAVLDRELNLQQDIDVGAAEQNLDTELPSGWLSSEFLSNSPSDLTLFVGSAGSNVLTLENALVANVNGWFFLVQHTNVINTNTVNLGAAPSGAASARTDLVILEVWRLLIAPAPSTVGKSPAALIWQQGNVATDPSNDLTLDYPDDILDATLGVESTRRVQLQYRLRVIPGVNIFSYPYGLNDPVVVANTVPPNAASPNGISTAYNYVNQSANGDPGLWLAGDGNPANALGTVDGYMYAIPLCAVFRRNSTAFNPFTNLNGAGAVAGSPPSDRPDGLFNDAFVADDLADLRMAVSPTGWNYQEVLDKNLNYLLDNSLRSEWGNSTSSVLFSYGGGVTGHSPMVSNQIGISSANGGVTPYSGNATGGGPLQAQFDNVCRTFSGRPIFETMTVAVPAPGGGWNSAADGAIPIEINPTALVVATPGYAAFNWAAFAPNNVQWVDVTNAYWIGSTSGKKTYSALGVNLVGTFHTINGNATVPSTFNQTTIVSAGDIVTFASQPGVSYTVLSVTGAHVVLTSPYSGVTNTATTMIDYGPPGGPPKSPRIASIAGVGSTPGLGTQPIQPITISMGTIQPLGLTNETLYVDILVAYPPGVGLTATPVSTFGTQTFLVNNPAAIPDSAPIYFDQTLLTPAGMSGLPSEYFNRNSLASVNDTHREARLTYTTSQVNNIVVAIEANSEITSNTSFVMPERINAPASSQIISVVKSPTPFGGGVSFSLDVSQRIVTISGGSTNPGDTLTVTYIALRPFPKNGEQVTVFFDQRAPQTSRLSLLNNPLPVIPKYISKQLYVLTSGVASPDVGYPYPNAYVQTGGINATAFGGGGLGESELGGEAFISIADFNASTGMLALPVYVNYSPDPNLVSFINPTSDVEGRSFFPLPQAGVYVPNAFAQNLSDSRRHKNFLAFLATLSTVTPLGFTGELVLVLLTRWAQNDAIDGVFFDDVTPSNNTTAASVFRLRNNMLVRYR
jgi:hypothetical protein